MASEEDRLDQLLKAARKQLGEETDEQEVDEEISDSMPAFKDIAQERDPEEKDEPAADKVSGKQEDNIAEEFNAADKVPDAVPEAPDPNAKMSDDEIAALFAAMGNEEATETDATGDVQADEPETESEEINVPVMPDPDKNMSDSDIEGLLDAIGAESGEDIKETEDHNLSQAEIEAMIAANGVSDMIVGGGNLDIPDEEDEKKGSDFPNEEMDLEEVMKQMAAAEAAGEEIGGLSASDDDGDFDRLMADLGEDDIDLSDIGDMIKKSDSGELVDPSIAADKPEAGEDEEGEEEENEEAEDPKKKRERKKKEKKVKKKKEKPESEEGAEKKEKKPGLFSKLVSALFTEEEEEDAAPAEAGATILSDENAAILKELDAENEDNGKKKKEKKKKEKKPKPEKPKKEKKPKPKKEKKPEEPDNSKHIPKKYIRRTVILAASIMIALVIVGTVLPGMLNMSDARKAFYEKDYKNAFLTLYGKDLNESDRKLYEKSRLLVMIDRKYESYEHYRAMGMDHDALDALLQGLKRYEDLKDKAKTLDVDKEAMEIRLKIVEALSSVYGMSEADALQTLKYSQADYTGKIDAVLQGVPYLPMEIEIFEQYGLEQEVNPGEEEISDDEVLKDLLPEEREFLDNLPAEEAVPDQETPGSDMPEEDSDNTLFYQDGNINIQIESDQF